VHEIETMYTDLMEYDKRPITYKAVNFRWSRPDEMVLKNQF